MPVVVELIRTEEDGTLSFGNYTLAQKAKAEDFASGGDLYKVKTYREITKLERNGAFAFESVPGTAVEHFKASQSGIAFSVEGFEDSQITLGLEEDSRYQVVIEGEEMGIMETNLSGKLVLSVELGERSVHVSVRKV